MLPKTVEVYKTNVEHPAVANRLLDILGKHFPDSHLNFDLEDSDRVLRIESNSIKNELVINLIQQSGFNCSILD